MVMDLNPNLMKMHITVDIIDKLTSTPFMDMNIDSNKWVFV